MSKKISLAITTYNRANRLIPYLKLYETYDNLDEIVIVDDYSNDFEILKKEKWHSKIRIEQNANNLGVYLNKINALSKATNDRVLLFDSDNFFKEDYLNILKDQLINDDFDDKIIYCAEKALPKFHYSNLSNLVIDKSNWNSMCGKEECFLNTGNQFHSKASIDCLLSNLKNDKTNPFATDSKYMNFLLVKNGFKLKCVHGLVYEHAMSKDSIWAITSKQSLHFNDTFNWSL